MVSRVASSLLIGVALGAIGTLLVRRLYEYRQNSDPDALVDRIASQVEALERRFGNDEAASAA
jgi:predicted dinucleotide-utilizing enzyme